MLFNNFSFPHVLKKSKVAVTALVLSTLVMGCNDDNDYDYKQYRVEVTNLTNGQPVSPLALAFHEEGHLWMVGEEASGSLEQLAESGDNSALLMESAVTSGHSGSGVIMPGMSETTLVSVDYKKAKYLSIVTMLVNTNDAFTGIDALDVSNLMVDESISVQTSSYDAGTEANSETVTTIPGPAAGGEGYNSERDDVNFVSMHSGVVSQDDGLMQSVLTEAHRFNNPTLSISITRIK